MTNDNHARGAHAALATFGLTKEAIDWGAVGTKAKEIAIGNPAKYWEQLNNGQLFTGKGEIARFLNPVVPGSKVMTGLNTGLMYGLPAYSLYQSLNAPPEARGSSVGGTVGGLVGGTIGAPLGLVGGMAGGMLGSTLGEALGRTFNTAPPIRRPEDPSPR